MTGIIILYLLVHLSNSWVWVKKKQKNSVNKTKRKWSYEPFNTIFNLHLRSTYIPHVYWSGKKHVSTPKVKQKKKRRAFEISHCLWLSSGDSNPTDILICLQIKKKCLSFQHVLFYFYYSFHKNKNIKYEKMNLNWILLGDV